MKRHLYQVKLGGSEFARLSHEDDTLRARFSRNMKDPHGRLMMAHGSYDGNVHIQNTWAFVDELIKANKCCEVMVYPMRMQGIADPPARIHLYSTMLDFWER